MEAKRSIFEDFINEKIDKARKLRQAAEDKGHQDERPYSRFEMYSRTLT